jgi:hypothetical protein
VRNYLDISWEDPEGDVKLAGIIARGCNYLNGAAGAELDYEAEELPRGLLFDFCRYVRSNALEDFEVNFERELLRLQMMTEVAAGE